MDNKKDRTMQKLDELSTKSSLLVYGSDNTLTDEDKTLKNIIRQTVVSTKQKFGERTNGKPINYFNELNFGNAFSEIFVDSKDKNQKAEFKNSPEMAFKKYMSANPSIDANALLNADIGRTMRLNNYRIIYNHISECSQALNIYKDNIMSPDDFTKLIFSISYENTTDDELKRVIENRLDDITAKYELEDIADSVIESVLKLGEAYVTTLSLENAMNFMLDDPVMKGQTLNEDSIRLLDKDLESIKVLKEDVQLDSDTLDVMHEMFGNELKDDDATRIIAEMINNNVIISSKNEMLLERFEADALEKSKNFNLSDIPGTTLKDKKKKASSKDTRPLYVNGSVVRILEPEKVIELRVDNTCYGYYYVEDAGNAVANQSYLGTTSGREVIQQTNLAGNNTIASTTQGSYTPATSAANTLGTSPEKLRFISDTFINVLSKKINKKFIRNNKQIKDFIYDLVRQDYIIKKGIRMTYFAPNEIVKFSGAPIYENIIFFAKLYLAVLVNDILVKLGRSHDKRVIAVDVGTDANYEQAINTVIRDIKTKDYKMDNLNDFNTILNLNPGRWDDLYIPTINGDRPIQIDTLAGMDTDINNEFMEFLKNSMMSGMGVPRNLIDATSDVDFARTVSSQNANFVRSVIKYQKKLTQPFTTLYQTLYKNEYRFMGDSESNSEANVDIDAITVRFPSPASLNMTNLAEKMQIADQNAEFIASQILPPKEDGSTEGTRVLLKTKIVKDTLPEIDWEKYEKFANEIKREANKEAINNPPVQPDMGMGGNEFGY